MALLKGVLKNAFGEPLALHTIVFTALKNTQTVLNTVISEIITDENGAYEKKVYQGRYQVDVYKDGIQKTTAGVIELYADSPDADINTYLTLPGEAEVTPEFIQQVIELKNQAIQAADSANAAKQQVNDDAKTASDAAALSVEVRDSVNQSEDNINILAQQVSDNTDSVNQSKASVESLASQVSQDKDVVSQKTTEAVGAASTATDAKDIAVQKAAEAQAAADAAEEVSALSVKSTDLSGDDGSKIVGLKINLPGAIRLTLFDYIKDNSISVKFFGAKGDGVTDDSDAFQLAFNSGLRNIRIPSVPVGYVIKKQLNITKGIMLTGDGVTPYVALGSPNTRGPGSWLIFDHPGKGLFINNPDVGFAGVTLQNFGTVRKHPTPGAGAFTPNVYDWDIEVNNTVDVSVLDMCLLNPYKGITSYGSQTRMTVDRLIGQPLKQGMVIQEAFDIHRINNVHFWCFWAQNQQVWNYTLANLDAFTLGRCDNHMYMNVFSIFHFRGLVIVNSANGTANKLKLSNVDLDRGYHGYVVDSAATGHTAQISNMTIQGETGVSGENYGIAIYANQCDLSFSNLDIRNLNNNAIFASGTYTNLGISEFYCSDWSKAHTSDPAINLVQANSICHINGSKRFYSLAGNTAARYGGQGSVRTLIDRGSFSGSTNASGDIVVPFSGSATPKSINFTNFNAVPLNYAVTARTVNNFTVRVFSGTTALTSTPVSFGWECSI